MNEGGFRRRMRDIAKAEKLFWEPVENTASIGIPDVYYHGKQGGWLELKYVNSLPARNTTSLFRSLNHGLTPEQINWALKFTPFSDRLDILVGYGRDRYFLVPGYLAEVFNDFTWPKLQEFDITKHDLMGYLKS